ncbi:MAG TPA: hypothetical protein VF049_00140 [Nocardioidaceae bacterium]
MTPRLWTDEEVSYLVDLAWDSGRAYEWRRIAEGQAELDACWRPVGRVAYEQRVAQRLREMEDAAARQPDNTWRGGYPGGPVDFETGALASEEPEDEDATVAGFIEDPTRCARCGASLSGDTDDTLLTSMGVYCRWTDCRPTDDEWRAYRAAATSLRTRDAA